MNMELINEQAGKIWQRFTSDAGVTPFKLDPALFRKLLEYFQVGNSYYFTYNYQTLEFEMMDSAIESVLGYPREAITMEHVLDKIHPDDKAFFLSFENRIVEFFLNLPVENILKYKARYDLRIMNGEGNYIRLLHQSMIISHDHTGRMSRVFCVHTDISYLNKNGKPVLSFVGMDGEPSFVDCGPDLMLKNVKKVLTKRERQILLLLLEGKISKEIAGILHISKQTVDTHRRNMLLKNGLVNTNELISTALKQGWL